MESKKGLIGAAVALVAVIALAAIGYNALGAQGAPTPDLSSLASSSANAGETASADAGASADAASAGASATSSTKGGSEGANETSAPSAQENSSPNAASDSSAENSDASVRFSDFTIEDLDGNEIKLSSFYGKPTLLGFWATWCPPCNKEAPHIQKLYETYGDRVNFVMIDSAGDGRDSPDIALDWMNEGGYSYPVYIDQTGEASKECMAYYLPTMIVLDSNGNVLTGFSGMIDEENGTRLIEQLLAL